MKRASLAALDWFIPHVSAIERSEVGLARNFVATHLLGPLLILSIVMLVFFADPQPGFACWAMMICVSGFWLLPLGLKLTQDLRLMALISVELLCVTSLIGTTFYGGVNSPFLPWLLVSLMLGLFYLSDHALPVLVLFAFNFVALIGAHAVCSFPQHLNPTQIQHVSWYSMFSATAYMSWMAIYYANIITMSSQLERETERHRLLARRLREAKEQADRASQGKAAFLAKMQRQLEQPLTHVVASSEALLARFMGDADGESWSPEVGRINAAGHRLLRLVRETLDLDRIPIVSGEGGTDEVDLVDFVERIGQESFPMLRSHRLDLVVDSGPDLGRVRIDAGKLRHLLEILVAQVAAEARPGKLELAARRIRKAGGDWLEIQIRPLPSHPGIDVLPASVAWWKSSNAAAEGDDATEKAQILCAILGGSLRTTHDGRGTWVTLEIPL